MRLRLLLLGLSLLALGCASAGRPPAPPFPTLPPLPPGFADCVRECLAGPTPTARPTPSPTIAPTIAPTVPPTHTPSPSPSPTVAPTASPSPTPVCEGPPTVWFVSSPSGLSHVQHNPDGTVTGLTDSTQWFHLRKWGWSGPPKDGAASCDESHFRYPDGSLTPNFFGCCGRSWDCANGVQVNVSSPDAGVRVETTSNGHQRRISGPRGAQVTVQACIYPAGCVTSDGIRVPVEGSGCDSAKTWVLQ